MQDFQGGVFYCFNIACHDTFIPSSNFRVNFQTCGRGILVNTNLSDKPPPPPQKKKKKKKKNAPFFFSPNTPNPKKRFSDPKGVFNPPNTPRVRYC